MVACSAPSLPVAVIGCGYWGKNYVRICEQLKQCTLKIVCDTSNAKGLADVKNQYPHVICTVSLDDVLQDTEIVAVFVIVPAALHHEVVLKCIKAGKHILIEKPLTIDVPSGEELIENARQAGLAFCVGHTYLYNDLVSCAKQIIEGSFRGRDYDFGNLHTMYSKRTNFGPIRDDVNAMWDLAPHDVSIFQNVMSNMKPDSVSAVGRCVLNPTSGLTIDADVVFLTILYPNGVIGNIHVSWLEPHKVRETVFVGSRARVVLDEMNSGSQIKVFQKGYDIQQDRSEFVDDNVRSQNVTFRDGDMIAPCVQPCEPLKAQVVDFLRAVAHEIPEPLADAKFGLMCVKILAAAQESLNMGGAPVPVK